MALITLCFVFYLMYQLKKSLIADTVYLSKEDIKSIIVKAIKNNKQLDISYNRYGKDLKDLTISQRTILPLKLDCGKNFRGMKYNLHPNFLYLNAVCKDKGNDLPFHFRLDNITSAKIIN